jgi:hypothetical protein
MTIKKEKRKEMDDSTFRARYPALDPNQTYFPEVFSGPIYVNAPDQYSHSRIKKRLRGEPLSREEELEIIDHHMRNLDLVGKPMDMCHTDQLVGTIVEQTTDANNTTRIKFCISNTTKASRRAYELVKEAEIMGLSLTSIEKYTPNRVIGVEGVRVALCVEGARNGTWFKAVSASAAKLASVMTEEAAAVYPWAKWNDRPCPNPEFIATVFSKCKDDEIREIYVDASKTSSWRSATVKASSTTDDTKHSPAVVVPTETEKAKDAVSSPPTPSSSPVVPLPQPQPKEGKEKEKEEEEKKKFSDEKTTIKNQAVLNPASSAPLEQTQTTSPPSIVEGEATTAAKAAEASSLSKTTPPPSHVTVNNYYHYSSGFTTESLLASASLSSSQPLTEGILKKMATSTAAPPVAPSPADAAAPVPMATDKNSNPSPNSSDESNRNAREIAMKIEKLERELAERDSILKEVKDREEMDVNVWRDQLATYLPSEMKGNLKEFEPVLRGALKTPEARTRLEGFIKSFKQQTENGKRLERMQEERKAAALASATTEEIKASITDRDRMSSRYIALDVADKLKTICSHLLSNKPTPPTFKDDGSALFPTVEQKTTEAAKKPIKRQVDEQDESEQPSLKKKRVVASSPYGTPELPAKTTQSERERKIRDWLDPAMNSEWCCVEQTTAAAARGTKERYAEHHSRSKKVTPNPADEFKRPDGTYLVHAKALPYLQVSKANGNQCPVYLLPVDAGHYDETRYGSMSIYDVHAQQ